MPVFNTAGRWGNSKEGRRAVEARRTASKRAKSGMMSRLLIKAIAFSLGLVAPGMAEEKFYQFNHEGPDPDHLLVVSGYWAAKLWDTNKALHFPYASLATMMTMESFGNCSGVCLAGLLPDFVSGNSPDKMKDQKYRLIFSSRPAVSAKQIPDGPLTTASVEVPVDFAIAMQRLWVQFVLGTGHRPTAEFMLDGKTRYFVARPGEEFISGCLMTLPEGGVCEKMSKFAESLQDLKDLSGDLKKQKLEVLKIQMEVLSKQFPALPDAKK